jgi:hypothetical protein
LENAIEQPHGGRFAGAIVTEKAKDFASANVQREIRNRNRRAKVTRQSSSANDRVHAAIVQQLP